MTHRMVAALLALVGFVISLYLWLWKVGLIGILACGDGGCETVQLSKYGDFLGVLFSGYLTYLEAAVIHAWCRWCVVSAVLVTVIFVTALAGWRRMHHRAVIEPPPG